jgi:PAS domain S-box-containing protein
MSIRLKTLLVASITFVLLVGSLYVFMYVMVRNSFLAIENTYTKENGNRVRDALMQEVENVNTKQMDWAHWDDPYLFLKTRDPAFMENNLRGESVRDIKLSTLLIFDEQLKLAAGQAAALPDGGEQKIPDDLISYIQSHPTLLVFHGVDDVVKGIVDLPESGIMIFVARGMTTSDLLSPVKGVMIFTRALDEPFLKNMREFTHLNFILEPLKEAETDAPDIANTIIGTKEVQTSVDLKDIEGNQTVHLIVKTPRDIYMQGMTIIRYFVLVLLLVGMVFVSVSLVLLSWSVIRPIERLIRDMKHVITDPHKKSRITVSGKDEVGVLAQNINTMLVSLESAYSENVEKSEQLSQTRKILEKQVADYKVQNDTLEQNKSAVMNILDDSRRLEVELRKQRDRTQAVITSVGEGLVVIDKNHQIRIMNPVAERMLGVKETDVKGLHFHDIVSVSKGHIPVPPGECLCSQAFEVKKAIFSVLEDDYWYHMKDGKKIPVSITVNPIFSDDKTVEAAVILFHDVTREREEKSIIEQLVKDGTRELVEKNIALEKTQKDLAIAGQEAEKERAKLTASIDSLTLGFVMTDENEKVLVMNGKSKQLTGLTDRPVMEFSDIEKSLSPGIDLHALHNQSKAERKSVKIDSFEHNGKYFRVFIEPIITGGSQLIGTVMVLEDITEATILQRSRDEFFSIASHELRTPLTAIRGNTELIRQYYGDKIKDKDFNEMIDDIHEGSVRLITLVNDFLDMSRIEQGRMKYAVADFDMSELIAKSLVMIEPMCKAKSCSLVFDKPQDPMMVKGDPDKTKEIILNLVGNAIKFTDTGTIKVAFDQSISVPNGKTGQIVATITDSGRGIPLANQSLLFRKFTQAGSSLFTRDTTKGTGLGLYISKLMGEGMGGSVFLVKSEEGKGSTFACSLPKA